MAGNNRYLRISQDAAEQHDELLAKAEKHILEAIIEADYPPSIRNLAEAFALVKGNISSTSTTEVKNG